MSTYISDKNPNDKEGLSDLELINQFYSLLKGEGDSNVYELKLSPEQAFHVIWHLQEKLRVLPDNIERCESCDDLYDTHESGLYVEQSHEGKHFFCGSCMDQVPEDY